MATIQQRLAQRIRFLRKEQKWTQEDLGEKSGLTYKFIGQIERGEVSPTLGSLDKLAKAFGLTVSELLDFQQKGMGKTKEQIFEELSKAEVATVKKVIDIFVRIFR